MGHRNLRITIIQRDDAFSMSSSSELNEDTGTPQQMDGNNLRGKKNRKFDLKFTLAVVKYAEQKLVWHRPDSLMLTQSAHGNGHKKRTTTYLSWLSMTNGLASLVEREEKS